MAMAILHSHHSLCNCATTKYVGLEKELFMLQYVMNGGNDSLECEL